MRFSTALDGGDRPTHGIELVNSDDDLLHAETAHKQRVLPRLPAALESLFECAARTIDDQDRNVRLSSSRDHVWHKVAVTGCVNEGEAFPLRREGVDCNVDGDAAANRARQYWPQNSAGDRNAPFPLLVHRIKGPGVCEAALANLLALSLVVGDFPVGSLAELVQNASHQGRLAGVDVACVPAGQPTSRKARMENAPITTNDKTGFSVAAFALTSFRIFSFDIMIAGAGSSSTCIRSSSRLELPSPRPIASISVRSWLTGPAAAGFADEPAAGATFFGLAAPGAGVAGREFFAEPGWDDAADAALRACFARRFSASRKRDAKEVERVIRSAGGERRQYLVSYRSRALTLLDSQSPFTLSHPLHFLATFSPPARPPRAPAPNAVPFLASSTLSSGLGPKRAAIDGSTATERGTVDAMRCATGARKARCEGVRALAKEDGPATSDVEEKADESMAMGSSAEALDSDGGDVATGGGGGAGPDSEEAGGAAAGAAFAAREDSIFCCSFESFFSGGGAACAVGVGAAGAEDGGAEDAAAALAARFAAIFAASLFFGGSVVAAGTGAGSGDLSSEREAREAVGGTSVESGRAARRSMNIPAPLAPLARHFFAETEAGDAERKRETSRTFFFLSSGLLLVLFVCKDPSVSCPHWYGETNAPRR